MYPKSRVSEAAYISQRGAGAGTLVKFGRQNPAVVPTANWEKFGGTRRSENEDFPGAERVWSRRKQKRVSGGSGRNGTRNGEHRWPGKSNLPSFQAFRNINAGAPHNFIPITIHHWPPDRKRAVERNAAGLRGGGGGGKQRNEEERKRKEKGGQRKSENGGRECERV